MNPNRVRELWDYLDDIGFRTSSRNPEWFQSVVVSMLLSPGTDPEIKAGGREVVRAMGLDGITHPEREIYPSFHLGCPGPRKYHETTGYRVGLNHSFDDLGVYCATHNRSWNEHEACTPSCRYGMRRRT